MTTELKSFEDRVLGAREKALSRERELYEEVLTRLIDGLGPMQVTSGALAELDALAALAELRTRRFSPGSVQPRGAERN